MLDNMVLKFDKKSYKLKKKLTANLIEFKFKKYLLKIKMFHWYSMDNLNDIQYLIKREALNSFKCFKQIFLTKTFLIDIYNIFLKKCQ